MGLIFDKGCEEALRLCANEQERYEVAQELYESHGMAALFFGWLLGRISALEERCAQLKESHDTLLTFTVGPLQLENAELRLMLNACQAQLNPPPAKKP